MERTERYLRPDGSLSSSRADAIRADPARVVSTARKYSPIVPAQYFLGTGDHESSLALNEIDTEPPTAKRPTFFVSKGIYQLSDDERKEAGLPDADLTDLDQATQVFARVSEKRARVLAGAAKVDLSSPPPDFWAYLAIAHNEGPPAALKAIIKHGGAIWYGPTGYAAMNPDAPIVAHGYGEDVITGGRYWSRAGSVVAGGAGGLGLAIVIAGGTWWLMNRRG